jgi:hypothetical protein
MITIAFGIRHRATVVNLMALLDERYSSAVIRKSFNIEGPVFKDVMGNSGWSVQIDRRALRTVELEDARTFCLGAVQGFERAAEIAEQEAIKAAQNLDVVGPATALQAELRRKARLYVQDNITLPKPLDYLVIENAFFSGALTALSQGAKDASS